MEVERITERLVLRRWRGGDRDPFAALCADPEVMEFFPAPLDRIAADALADRADAMFDSHGYGLWAVERRDTAEFIGFTGLAPLPAGVPGAGGVEVGWRLARDQWGHGFATEAAGEALSFAFDDVGLDEVGSITAVVNSRSRAVMERIGMRQADLFEHPRIDEGSPLRPHVRYLLTRTEQTARLPTAPLC
ncbi:GNAT family N-acetyltransferase [Amnibacterium flavum]|uniref:GNAT family N-acetyltransferase n=1 Tax=Amnibacterium flavum TaxID=2173173 RepID=A0A2V1HU11_9MICO|nr:GNAT family N-acetyltransferase [Amnibacterium flavum]PVZ93584.1 GNAT family N-acetyltransferase [Amnibacterium flavum]